MLDKYPEARPFGELRQEWRGLYERVQRSKTGEGELGERELAARLKMAAAYEVLPLEVKAMLVI